MLLDLFWKRLLAGTTPVHDSVLTGRVPVNNSMQSGIILNKYSQAQPQPQPQLQLRLVLLSIPPKPPIHLSSQVVSTSTGSDKLLNST